MADDPKPDIDEQHKRNGWTADTLQAYNDAIELNINARHFGGNYADPEIDRMMKSRAVANKVRVENVAGFNPLNW